MALVKSRHQPRAALFRRQALHFSTAVHKVNPEEEQDKGKAALTELFMEARNEDTPVIVERIVNDIDEIVRMVRFPGWQSTSAGEREVQKALRKTLLKYKV